MQVFPKEMQKKMKVRVLERRMRKDALQNKIGRKIQDQRNVVSENNADCDREDLEVVMAENKEIPYEGILKDE